MEDLLKEKTELTAVKTYSSSPDTEGFFYENADDESMSIHCKVYDNGNKIKKTILPVCKKEAVVRELTGKDTKDIARFMDREQEKYTMASVTVATTIDGQKQPFEIYEAMKMKDYQLILSMCQDLNF